MLAKKTKGKKKTDVQIQRKLNNNIKYNEYNKGIDSYKVKLNYYATLKRIKPAKANITFTN